MLRSLALAVLLATASACGSDTPETPMAAPPSEAETDAALGTEVSGEREIEIETEPGTAVLGLTDEVIYYRAVEAPDDAGALSEAAMDAIDAMGGYTVQALLDDVTEVRYEDGRLVVETAGESAGVFEDDGSGAGTAYAQFSEADARDFVAAYERLRAE